MRGSLQLNRAQENHLFETLAKEPSRLRPPVPNPPTFSLVHFEHSLAGIEPSQMKGKSKIYWCHFKNKSHTVGHGRVRAVVHGGIVVVAFQEKSFPRD